ncbi:hypothetical protein HPB52_006195 [Rhipicephalus sanguineus]|uniref:Uncharacterized protein n=1 Tax=Rhipicephalus sanguineus TaxID=34632 RepID=A0A9D4STS4_RHISA|nr:hypothetical protein HPB52_006195 [Rhipicephalus sanguineus]
MKAVSGSERRGISPGAEETRGATDNDGYRRPSGGSPTRPMTLAAATSLPCPTTHDYVTAGTSSPLLPGLYSTAKWDELLTVGRDSPALPDLAGEEEKQQMTVGMAV